MPVEYIKCNSEITSQVQITVLEILKEYSSKIKILSRPKFGTIKENTSVLPSTEFTEDRILNLKMISRKENSLASTLRIVAVHSMNKHSRKATICLM